MGRKRVVEETAAEEQPEVPSKRPKLDAFSEIAKRSKSFRPARQVLRRVRAVPTIFPAVDFKTRVGGWPIDRITLVHGPSAKGKTVFTHGLGLSFLRRGHAYAFIDAEHTTPIPWMEMIFGEHADNSHFIASRPDNYEQATDDVDRIANGIAEARQAGKLPPWFTCFFVVDSLGCLVPQDLLAKMEKHAAESKDGSVDGMRGASGMIQAAYNKSWLRRLVPLMSSTGCGIAIIVREAVDMNASANDRKFGKDWKMTGGVSGFYEASLDVRVAGARMLHEAKSEEGKKNTSPVTGELHTVEIYKTKVSAREAEIERTFFHTSNGLWTPEGFDRARDLLELGKLLGVIKVSGAWTSFGGRRFQGEKKFLQSAVPEYLDTLEAACREKFGAEKIADVVDGIGG
jgi:RecA/RadA recombinase